MTDMLVSHQIHDDVLQILQPVHCHYMKKSLFAKPLTNKSVADFTRHQVEMLE